MLMFTWLVLQGIDSLGFLLKFRTAQLAFFCGWHFLVVGDDEKSLGTLPD
jgi:hypothetical protein